MPIRLFAFVVAATFSLTAAAMADGGAPGKKVSVDLSGFCGRWQVIVPKSDPAQKSADISHCTPGNAPGFAALDCDVEIPEGRHQLQFHGNQGSQLIFVVDAAGNVAVEAPNDGVMADGGKGVLKLHLVPPKVDKSGFVGRGGFENVAWNEHPDPACNSGDRWAALPRGSTFMLTPSGALITSDRNGNFHSSKTSSIQAFPLAGLIYKTARVLVYPEKGSEGEPWMIWEQEAGNTPVPGMREVVLIRDGTWELRTGAGSVTFAITAGCRAEPDRISSGNSRFRLLAMCD
jgi:hypothetical protein